MTLSISPEAAVELLGGAGEFQEPARVLAGLDETAARVVPPGSPHSIAQIVAHLHFYQRATLATAQGLPSPNEKPAHLEDTFAPPAPGAWPTLSRDFLAGVEEAKRLAAESGRIPGELWPDDSPAYTVAEGALHNAYHLGQIVLLRQMLDLWPPPGGDDDDF